MPMTPELRRGMDRIRDYLYGGGYPNPAQNAEQLSFLIYFYMYEAADAARVRAARRPEAAPYSSAFDGIWQLRNPRNAPEDGAGTVSRQLLRWSSWTHGLNGERLVNWVREEVFPFHADLASNGATDFMDGARLVIDEPTVLTQVVSQLNDLHLDRVDADTKGDLFEHVLRQIRQQGELGQFRTPRHIIRTIVQLVDPRIGETVYDPAAGTAGFLVAAWDHIRLANSSPDGIEGVETDGKTLQRGLGDMLSRRAVRTLQEETLYGADVDPQFVRLATMNLTLRGLDQVRVLRRDALTRSLDRATRASLAMPADGFDVVLANPPFKGSLDEDRIIEEVKVGQSTRTELLFLKHMLNQLKEGGRCGVVVLEGVLFNSAKAHRELRRQLVENNTVEAVFSLPNGVFNPYSGVKTSVLVFRKGGSTQQVMFLQADNDGFKLDANHDQPIDKDDLPGLVAAYRERTEREAEWHDRDPEADWMEKWWFAEIEAIREADFNLSGGRHRPQSRAPAKHRAPLEILNELRAIEVEILEEIDTLSSAVAEATSE
ncbi:MAG: N-6 DNA methylase [Gammaproteobacteria bacterium]|nr:N-6 DNA methylase [Gammaproteobacteria bacterium]MYE51422.1 N-6 DNA methylase [Gammaproteobacteria bacterium]